MMSYAHHPSPARLPAPAPSASDPTGSSAPASLASPAPASGSRDALGFGRPETVPQREVLGGKGAVRTWGRDQGADDDVEDHRITHADPFHQKLRRSSYLRRRSDCFRLERPVAGWDLHPLEVDALARRTVFADHGGATAGPLPCSDDRLMASRYVSSAAMKRAERALNSALRIFGTRT